MPGGRFVLTVFVASFCAACSYSPGGTVSTPTAYGGGTDQRCAAPMERDGEQCVLAGDIVLEAPLQLSPQTTLDCRRHAITAAHAGVPCPVKGGCTEYQPSVPEVAIYVEGARGVRIVNCVLRGFDFGIVIANAKSPDGRGVTARNEIASNDVSARTGIEIVASDATVVRDNTIRYGNGANGVGIVAWGDSDHNEFRNNRVVATAVDGRLNGPQWPGAVPTLMRPDGIRTYSGTQARTVINVIVAGRLMQAVSDDTTRQEGTLIESNEIDIPPSTSDTNGYAIVVADQTNCVVRGNTIRRALHGLHVSGMMGMMKPAGTCSGNRSRRCLEERDCFLPGIDAATAGTCDIPPPFYSFSTSTGLRFLDNHILGPLTEPGFDCVANAECSGVRPTGIAVYPNAVGIVVEGNDVANAQFTGIDLILKSAESAIVTRNVVRECGYSLAFRSVPPGERRVERATRYGAVISRNDFVGHQVRAVYSSQFFTLPAELSDPATGEGNYWGRPCGGGGFTADDARAGILDSHPFGEPVARRSEPQRPCR